MHTDQRAGSNISERLGAPPVQAPTSVAGYSFEATPDVPIPTQHMVYAGEDGLIHELWRESGQWQLNTLSGTGSPRAVDSPSAFTDYASSSQNVFYISDANEVVELRWSPRGVNLVSGFNNANHGRNEKQREAARSSELFIFLKTCRRATRGQREQRSIVRRFLKF